jgi:hypothetical protein
MPHLGGVSLSAEAKKRKQKVDTKATFIETMDGLRVSTIPTGPVKLDGYRLEADVDGWRVAPFFTWELYQSVSVVSAASAGLSQVRLALKCGFCHPSAEGAMRERISTTTVGGENSHQESPIPREETRATKASVAGAGCFV